MRWLIFMLLSGCGPARADGAPPVIVEAAPVPASTEEVEPGPAESPSLLTLEASGDIVLNGLAMRAVRASGNDMEGYRALLSGYGRVLEPGALTYVNLEMPLVDDRVELDGGWPASRTERPRRAPVLGATPALASVLASLGVELVGVANNHALDQNYTGLSATIAALDSAGLVHAGAGPTDEDAYTARLVRRGDLVLAFLSATEPLNRRAHDAPRLAIARLDPETMLLAAIARAREEADVVVLAVHWSTDFVMDVQPSQRALARRLVDAGADVILGTGPHVLQSVERMDGPSGDALVAYSLGNLASGMGRAYRFGEVPEGYIHPANIRPEARDGVVLRIEIQRVEGRLAIRGELRLLFTANDWRVVRDTAPVHLAVQALDTFPPEVCRDRLEPMRLALGTVLPILPDSCSH